MTLIKTSLLNAIAVAIRMLTLLGINKILAIYVGPNGYAAIGQFQNAVQMITAFSSGIFSTGVTKYTAEYHDDEQKQHQLWRTAGAFALIGSVVIGGLIIVFSEYISVQLFNNKKYSTVFLWLGFFLFFSITNTFLLAILNGKGEIKKYVAANVCGNILVLIFTSLLVYKFGLYGAFISVATYQAVGLAVTIYFCKKAIWFNFQLFFGKINKAISFKLVKYSLMIIVTSICTPISYILIRKYISDSLGSDFAGYWEAMSRLSSAYLMFITSTLSVYFIPKISSLTSAKEIKREIRSGLKIVVPLALITIGFVYILRFEIIELLFSKKFLPMEELFSWQMVGDALRVVSWVISYVMLSKAMIKTYISTEILFSFLLLLFVIVLSPIFGFKGVAIAYALNYFIYFPIMILFVYKRIY